MKTKFCPWKLKKSSFVPGRPSFVPRRSSFVPGRLSFVPQIKHMVTVPPSSICCVTLCTKRWARSHIIYMYCYNYTSSLIKPVCLAYKKYYISLRSSHFFIAYYYKNFYLLIFRYYVMGCIPWVLMTLQLWAPVSRVLMMLPTVTDILYWCDMELLIWCIQSYDL